MSEYLNYKVKHPDFKYIFAIGAGGHPVVIFGRDHRKDPTPKQVKKYEANRKIVEAHGGCMRVSLYSLGEEIPAFAQADIDAMIAAVTRDLHDYEVANSWNGLGLHTFSVSIRKKVGK